MLYKLHTFTRWPNLWLWRKPMNSASVLHGRNIFRKWKKNNDGEKNAIHPSFWTLKFYSKPWDFTPTLWFYSNPLFLLQPCDFTPILCQPGDFTPTLWFSSNPVLLLQPFDFTPTLWFYPNPVILLQPYAFTPTLWFFSNPVLLLQTLWFYSNPVILL